MFISFNCIRQYTAIGIMLAVLLCMNCSTESDRTQPYVYFPALWDSWYLSEVWYYGENDTCRAEGTGTLELKSFGEKFGDEHYSLEFDITVPLPDDTIVITKAENGLYYIEEEDADNKISFFPDSSPNWHSTIALYNVINDLLRIEPIPVTSAILWTDWQRIE